MTEMSCGGCSSAEQRSGDTIVSSFFHAQLPLALCVQCQDDANVKMGDSRTMHARTTLARILKDSAFVTSLPVAQRLCPCSLATAALAGVSPLSSISIAVGASYAGLHLIVLVPDAVSR